MSYHNVIYHILLLKNALISKKDPKKIFLLLLKPPPATSPATGVSQYIDNYPDKNIDCVLVDGHTSVNRVEGRCLQALRVCLCLVDDFLSVIQ